MTRFPSGVWHRSRTCPRGKPANFTASSETLGKTVERILEGDAARRGDAPLSTRESFADTSEYADMGPQVLEAVAQVTPG